MRLGHGDPCAPACAQLADVQPVEVVRRQTRAPGEDGDLEPPSSQCPQLRGRRGFHELNPQARVVGEQPGDGARKQHCRCGGEPSDGQPAGQPVTQSCQLLARGRDAVEDLAGMPHQHLPGRGQPHTARVPLEQRRAGGLLGDRHLPRHRRLGVPQPLGRRAERTGARHLQHHTQASQGQLGHPPSLRRDMPKMHGWHQ
jgi:hypothetical protein